MATYMYTSATGKNWADDDEDDFDFSPEVYKAAAEFSAAPTFEDLDALQFTRTEEDILEIHELTTPAPPEPTFDHRSFDFDNMRTPVGVATQCWHFGKDCRPAYVELTNSEDRTFRDNYHSNWLATKLRVGANMKHPLMMKPSPLQQSMTWEEDFKGAFIKYGGLFIPAVLPSPSPPSPSPSSPALSYDGLSEEEKYEACTPPRTPSTLNIDFCKDKVEVSASFHKHARSFTDVDKYDPVTAAIDNPINNKNHFEADMSRTFAGFSGISDTLNVDDIVGEALRDMMHSDSNKPSQTDDISPSEELRDQLLIAEATFEEDEILDVDIEILTELNTEEVTTTSTNGQPRLSREVANTYNKALELINFVKKAEATMELNTINIEAIQTSKSKVESQSEDTVADHNQLYDNRFIHKQVIDDSTTLSKTTRDSPDIKYVTDPTNTSLVWNTVAAGWFALASVPWGRITVAAAGALVDVAAFIARR